MPEHTTERVKQILSWYPSDNPGTLANLHRLLMSGKLAGHGQARHPAGRPGLRARPGPVVRAEPAPATTPTTTSSWPSTRAATPTPRRSGFIEAVAGKYAGQIPLILKLNNSDSLVQAGRRAHLGDDRLGATTRCASAAPPSATPSTPARTRGTRSSRTCARSPRRPRRRAWRWWCGATRAAPGVSKEGETAVDIAGYAAQIACQMGAHVVKVKPPKAMVEHAEAKKVYEEHAHPHRDAR